MMGLVLYLLNGGMTLGIVYSTRSTQAITNLREPSYGLGRCLCQAKLLPPGGHRLQCSCEAQCPNVLLCFECQRPIEGPLSQVPTEAQLFYFLTVWKLQHSLVSPLIRSPALMTHFLDQTR